MRKRGRPYKLTPSREMAMIAAYEEHPEIPVWKLAKRFRVSRRTVYNAIERRRGKA